jgi:hypothetical protein
MVALRACMIQSRNPLSVNASGITKLSSTMAEVDSMSRYTRPMAYRTILTYVSQLEDENSETYLQR